jgi:hypothetical protein
VQPLIRATACWNLGQYATYIVCDDDLLPAVLQALLPACLDHTKRVSRSLLGHP